MELTLMEKIVSLAKRRGFVFPSSEIYGGFAAIYDYGHYGTLLKNNIRDSWIKSMIYEHDDVVLLDGAIFMSPKTWEASGHLDNFDDPQVDCKKCHNRMRADHLLEEILGQGDYDSLSLEAINSKLEELKANKKLKCLECGSTDLTEAKRFSLMVKSNLGAPTEALSDSQVVYLRPETCGSIYLQYKNILDSTCPKLPFGVAQVGKAFRNEIVARQFIFRTREFEQMEMQYFLPENLAMEKFEEWKKARLDWYLQNGLSSEDIRWHQHEKLAHYAKAAEDIEYNFRSLGGFKEVEGVHARGDWDLSQHSKFSGVDLSYFDETIKAKYIPHVVETSAGLNRLLFMFLDKAYTEEKVNDEIRTVMKFPYHLSPVKAAIFPLLKNKPELVAKAQEVYKSLRNQFVCEFDDSGNIGKRYRRQDEIGTPFCITIDFDSLENNDATVRDRDSMAQERIKLSELANYIKQRI